MRPLRLSLTAFGPYAGTEVVDFDALTELGLFVVAGNNGAGKTTIFDALHYSLFGTLPGRRATYIRLKSDHADDTVECSVALDFTAQGKYWRVERSPKQRRPKRRGNGFTEVDRRATLYQLEIDPLATHDAPVATAVANKIGEVDEKCRELVGLSGKQFERVALLPQGEFSRVLRESSTDRRELLRTLFSSEIFGDATTLLNEQAAAATAADRSIIDRLDHQQATLAASLSQLLGKPVAAATADVRGALADFRRTRLSDLGAQVAKLEHTAAETAQQHQRAAETAQRLQRRTQVAHEHQVHQAAEPQHRADTARLELGRAAVPVVNLVRTTQEQEHRHTTLTTSVHQLEERLGQALDHAGAPSDEPPETRLNDLASLAAAITQLTDRLRDRHQAAARVRDLDATVNQCRGELRRTTNDIANLEEQMTVARTRLRKLNNENDALDAAPDLPACEQQLRTAEAQLHQRHELDTLESQHQALVRQLSELDATVAQNQTAFEQASQAYTSLPGLQQKADAALAALESCTRRSTAAQAFAEASARLRTTRSDHQQAAANADHLWDAFIAGTAARVAETLTDEEPCPVCGSCEHPSPASFASTDHVATQADVTQARATADALHDQVRQIQTQIENLQAVDHDIATISAAEAAAEISTSKAMALGARTLAEDARHAAAQRDQLAHELDQNQATRTNLDTQLRALDERLNQLRGALGPLIHETIQSLQTQADVARQARATAERRLSRGHELATELAAAESDVDAIGLEQIAAQARRSATEAQLVERQHEHDQATDQLQLLDDELAPAGVKRTVAHNSVEQRAQATRHASELISKLTTARARVGESTNSIRRARSLLDDRISQSPFSNPDAALAAFVEPGVIEQLEAQVSAFLAADERLRGQLQELAGLPETAPDTAALKASADQAAQTYAEVNRSLITMTSELDRIETELESISQQRLALQNGDLATRRLERVAALVKGDNDRNTSLENWVLAAHLRDVVELANIRLARSTHQRFQLCVLDDGENKRGKWGLDLGVEDTVTGTRRPTAGLSGGELFQASLALALGLADAVMNQTSGVQIDALFIDEGFGSLDEVSVERAIDLLDELRDRGAMVGVITHVPALLDALPLGVSVVDSPDGQGSTIRQRRLAA